MYINYKYLLPCNLMIHTCVMYTAVAVVGLERTFYQVSEDVGVMEVCAIVYSPNDNVPCKISFAFDVSFSTSNNRFSTSDGSAGDGSAGDGHYCIHTLNIIIICSL